MMYSPFARFISIAVAGGLLPLATTPAAAQRPSAGLGVTSDAGAATAPDRVQEQRAAWRFRPAFAGMLEYDDNVFLLPEGRKSSVGSPSAAEERSGRYDDMESARDAVASLDAALRVTGHGYGGRSLEIRPAVDFQMHALNTSLTNATLGLAVEQDLARAGRLRGRAAYTPPSFRRNYLAGVIDENGDGYITAGERRYERGEARDLRLAADYRHRLRKSRKASPLGVTAQLGAGMESRSHAPPFAARDYLGPTGEARLLLDLAGRLDVDLGYGIGVLGATPTQEVMLVEEASGRRAVSGTADRSRTEHTVSGRVRIEITRRSDLSVEAERRARTFTSQESSDVRYNGRRDSRNSLDAELTSRLRSGVRAVARVRFARQDLVRGASVAGDEVDDYTRLRAALGLRLTF